MRKMEQNDLKILINNIEIADDKEETSIRDKFNKIFNIFEGSLNHSFEESINIYYRKIFCLLRKC